MDKLTSIHAFLDGIRQSQGNQFECNEEELLQEYSRTDEELKPSLAIKILSIFGGFLSSGAFLGFLAIAGLFDSEIALLIFGIVFILASIVLNRMYDQLILGAFSVSLYAIGIALCLIGLNELSIDENIVVLVMSLIALGCLWATQNFILSFLSILVIGAQLLSLIFINKVYAGIHLYVIINALFLTYLYLNEASIISLKSKLSTLYNPLRIAVIFSFLFGLVAIGKRYLIPDQENYIWFSSVPLILITFFVVDKILKSNGVNASRSKSLVLSFCAPILLSTAFSPAISGAMLIILLTYLVNYKTGLVIGIASLIYFVSQFYYDLNFTLLTKSIILMASGVSFLLLYVFMIKKINSDEKV